MVRYNRLMIGFCYGARPQYNRSRYYDTMTPVFIGRERVSLIYRSHVIYNEVLFFVLSEKT